MALAVSFCFFLSTYRYPLVYDSVTYWGIAKAIAAHGIFSDYPLSDLRTYGYPFVIRLLLPAEQIGISARFLLFLLQMGLYLGGALLLRRDLPEEVRKPVFVGLCLNVFVLAYLPEVLTDSFGAAALPLLVWLLLRRRLAELALGSLLVGFLIAVRPGNVLLLPAWGAGILVATWHNPRRLVATSALAAVLIALPLVPQVINNVRYHNKLTPFIAFDLAKTQHLLGVQSLKYATGWPDTIGSTGEYRRGGFVEGEFARVFYVNPLFEGKLSEDTPLRWYLDNPGRGALTAALHFFALVDVDLLFPFSMNLAPDYRWPLGILNHIAIALAIAGLVTARRWGSAAVWAVGAGLLAGTVAVYGPSAVESRFGLPLLVAMGPLAMLGLSQVLQSRKRAAIWCTCGLYVVAALSLSEWMRDQAPFIRAHKAAQCGGLNAFVDDMVRAFAMTSRATTREHFVHTLAEHVYHAHLNPAGREQGLKIAAAIDGGAAVVSDYVRQGWGVDITPVNLPDKEVPADVNLIILTKEQTGRPVRYPCIDGRRVADDARHEASAEIMKALRQDQWSQWTVIRGPYYNAVLYRRRSQAATD